MINIYSPYGYLHLNFNYSKFYLKYKLNELNRLKSKSKHYTKIFL